ncbi:putative low-complexity protein [Desulfosporosinus orientis DSM 765]|uniref:Putative low-complexity protein n=1 Tax=Desulfosporosinus orientis (strain ATCC 19365 / DSM 765 / NCIMB 8382 / VKM B-1628 / Singapore I) TaxID=768706 RepID=G7WIK1_DESOD|nr:pentapeptide repeat-containing protein [Desulfosporosinus orientis]AET69075.1 putative low-complexity protein [Desulfosporosinus orientis DSM 765]
MQIDISRSHLRADCNKCFGLCCTALYFAASEGFPKDKEAGKPCHHLQTDFRCRIHADLREQGFKGCLAYDCIGAGQKVAQIYGGQDWRKAPELAREMFEVFLIMWQLHEMLWYLTEGLTLEPARSIHTELYNMQEKIDRLTLLRPESLLELDVPLLRAEVNTVLLKTSELVRKAVRSKQQTSQRRQKNFKRGADLMAADLRTYDLRGANLRGACLIAADLRGTDLWGADLIGADFRDTDLRGADLSQSLFLTQGQINAARGDKSTKLPLALSRPAFWEGCD